ncbi:jg19196 [Pararge aegeria aegeria]|uniref:Jg19196 protein n=1 Tax=Pararge aegeria aegeria TaxID=348720 RepID=A0A8S4SJ65_9NEOP|nr:jg19196 [Pararge aegeria aegeria]
MNPFFYFAANKLCEELNGVGGGSEPPVGSMGGKWAGGCGLLRQPSGFPLLGVAPPNYLLSDHLGTLAKTNNHLF